AGGEDPAESHSRIEFGAGGSFCDSGIGRKRIDCGTKPGERSFEFSNARGKGKLAVSLERFYSRTWTNHTNLSSLPCSLKRFIREGPMIARSLQRWLASVTPVVLFLTASAIAQSTPAANSESRADAILKQMTLEEKIDYIGGIDGFFIRDIPRLSVPRLKMADGPIGVRNFGPATTMAGGIAMAATWNPAIAARVGAEIGRDARA